MNAGLQSSDGPIEGGALVGIKCSECGTAAFPPQSVCPSCMSTNVDREVMPDEGEIYSLSTVHAAPKKWATPYTIGYVDLPNKVRVFTHLRGESLKIGDRVRLSSGIVGTNADGTQRIQFVFEKAGASA